MKNEHASYPSIYENILREKNELLVKVEELQIENDDLKIRLKRFTDVASTSNTVHVQNQAFRTRSGPVGYHPTNNSLVGCHSTSTEIMIFTITLITTTLQILFAHIV